MTECKLEAAGIRVTENPDARLTLPQITSLALLMLEKREQLSAGLIDLNGKILMNEDCSLADPVEAASQREEADRASAIAMQQSQTINAIDEAFLRLQQGHYGVSKETGEPISHERLQVVPWAVTEPALNPMVLTS